MSRLITVCDGISSTTHKLSIATLHKDNIGQIISFSIEPYTHETENVVYHDKPLTISRITDSNLWQIKSE